MALCVAVLTGAEVAGAQQRSALVVIVSDTAARPIDGAVVAVESGTATARTDSAGRAVLHDVDGEIWVSVRKVGFTESRRRVIVPRGQTTEARVVLTSIQALARVRIVGKVPLPAELERRRSAGAGTFWGPEEIATAPHLKALLGRTRGVRLWGGGILLVTARHPNLAGDCWADVYIDGQLTAPSVASVNTDASRARFKFEELAMLPPAAVYAMEVYPRASQAPQSVIRLRDGCGVILVWTRSYAERRLLEEARRAQQEQGGRQVAADSGRK